MVGVEGRAEALLSHPKPQFFPCVLRQPFAGSSGDRAEGMALPFHVSDAYKLSEARTGLFIFSSGKRRSVLLTLGRWRLFQEKNEQHSGKGPLCWVHLGILLTSLFTRAARQAAVQGREGQLNAHVHQPPFAGRLKKADGFEEEECIRHPAHQPDGGESEDANGHGLTVFSCRVIPGS